MASGDRLLAGTVEAVCIAAPRPLSFLSSLRFAMFTGLSSEKQSLVQLALARDSRSRQELTRPVDTSIQAHSKTSRNTQYHSSLLVWICER
jgi:hypothetical protein